MKNKAIWIGALIGLGVAILDILITALIKGGGPPITIRVSLFFYTILFGGCSDGCWGLLVPLMIIGILLSTLVGTLIGLIIQKIKRK